MAAVDAYNKAAAAWESHKATYYNWWEMDEPITPGERRADEQIQRKAKQLRDALVNAQAAVISEAQALRLTYQPGKK